MAIRRYDNDTTWPMSANMASGQWVPYADHKAERDALAEQVVRLTAELRQLARLTNSRGLLGHYSIKEVGDAAVAKHRAASRKVST